jgi:hypothetical protein
MAISKTGQNSPRRASAPLTAQLILPNRRTRATVYNVSGFIQLASSPGANAHSAHWSNWSVAPVAHTPLGGATAHQTGELRATVRISRLGSRVADRFSAGNYDAAVAILEYPGRYSGETMVLVQWVQAIVAHESAEPTTKIATRRLEA